jgi:hypothetical protein
MAAPIKVWVLLDILNQIYVYHKIMKMITSGSCFEALRTLTSILNVVFWHITLLRKEDFKGI